MSGVYSNRNQRDRTGTSFDLGDGSTFDFDFRGRGNLDGRQLEAQVLSNLGRARIVAGGGAYHVDEDLQIVERQTFDGSTSESDLLSDPHSNTDSAKVYSYAYIDWPERAIFTIGMGLNHSDETGDKETEPTPKLGVEYRATDRLTLRAAAFRTVKSNIIAQQTIEPTTVAGFNQVFDDFNGTKADQAGIGADYRLTQDVTIGAEGVYRDLSLPRLDEGQLHHPRRGRGDGPWLCLLDGHGPGCVHDGASWQPLSPAPIGRCRTAQGDRRRVGAGVGAVFRSKRLLRGRRRPVCRPVRDDRFGRRQQNDSPGAIPGCWTPRLAIGCRIVVVSSVSS